MGLAIDKTDLDADHRMSLRTFRQRGTHALFHRCDEAARHHATDDAVVEHDKVVVARRHIQHHVRELALATGLLDQPPDDTGHRAHRRLLVGHAWRTHGHLGLPFAAQALDHHFQVQLAHAPDQGFTRFPVRFHTERGVFLGQAGQPLRHPDQVRRTRRLQPPGQHRRLSLDVLQAQRLRTAAQRLATDRILPAQYRDNVTGHGLLDVMGLVGLHPHQATDTPPLRMLRTGHRVAHLQGARVQPHEAQRAVLLVGDLEQQACQWTVRIRRQHHLALIAFGADSRAIQRRRQVLDHGIQQRLDALVLERSTGQHRHAGTCQRRPPDRRAQHIGTNHATFQPGIGQFFLMIGHSFDQRIALGLPLGPRRFVPRGHRGCAVLLPLQHALIDQIDPAVEAAFAAQRHAQRPRPRAKLVLQLLQHAFKRSAYAVHLVDESDQRHAMATRLAPHRLGLRLHAVHGREDGHGTVEHAQ